MSLKIEKCGLEELTLGLLIDKKLGYYKTAKVLNEKGYPEIHWHDIVRFKKKILPEVIEKNPDQKEKIKMSALTLLDALSPIEEEIKKKLEELKKEGNWKAQRDFLSILLREIGIKMRFTSKLMNIVNKSELDETNRVNTVKFNSILWDAISKLIDDGHISLDACDDVIKDMYNRHKMNHN